MKSNNSNYEQKYKYKYYKSKGGMNTHREMDDIRDESSTMTGSLQPHNNIDIYMDDSIANEVDYTDTDTDKSLKVIYDTYLGKHNYFVELLQKNNKLLHGNNEQNLEIKETKYANIPLEMIPARIKQTKCNESIAIVNKYQDIHNSIYIIEEYEKFNEDVKNIVNRIIPQNNPYQFKFGWIDINSIIQNIHFCISFLIIFIDIESLLEVLEPLLLNYNKNYSMSIFIYPVDADASKNTKIYDIIYMFGICSDYIILCNVKDIIKDSFIINKIIMNNSYKIIQYENGDNVYNDIDSLTKLLQQLSAPSFNHIIPLISQTINNIDEVLNKPKEVPTLHNLCAELNKLLDNKIILTDKTKLLFLLHVYEYFYIKYETNLWLYNLKYDYYNHYWENNDMLYTCFNNQLLNIMVDKIFSLVNYKTFRYNNLCKIPLLIYTNYAFVDWYKNKKKSENILLTDFNVNECYVANPLNLLSKPTSLYWSGQVTIYTSSENRFIQTRISGGLILNVIVIFFCNSNNLMNSEILLIREIKNVGGTLDGYIYELPNIRVDNSLNLNQGKRSVYDIYIDQFMEVFFNEQITKHFIRLKNIIYEGNYELSLTGCTNINTCNVYSCRVDNDLYSLIQQLPILKQNNLTVKYGKFVPLNEFIGNNLDNKSNYMGKIDYKIYVDASMMGIILEVLSKKYNNIGYEDSTSYEDEDSPSYQNLKIIQHINNLTKKLCVPGTNIMEGNILETYSEKVQQLQSQLNVPNDSSILPTQFATAKATIGPQFNSSVSSLSFQDDNESLYRYDIEEET